MTWEQKLQACQAIGEISLSMRKPGDWYVNHDVDVKEGSFLHGGCVTGAATPEAAVEQHWKWLTTLSKDQRIVIHAGYEDRTEVRWNGFMWEGWKD